MSNSLPAKLLRSLILGKSLVGGAHAADPRSPIVDADELLLSILRQRYLHGGYRRGYRGRLDGIVSNLSNVTEEAMVSGRIYTGVGSDDLDSLQDGQLALMLLVARRDWMPSKSVERLLTEWVRSDDERLRSLGQDLDRWKTALERSSFKKYKNLFDCVSQESDWAFDDSLNTLRSFINALSASVKSTRADALDEFEISDTRLRNIGAWASQTAFSQNTGAFPLPLFNAIPTTTELPFEQRSCILRRVDKGEYTEPLMAQLPVNEQEFYALIVRNHVGQVLLSDLLQNLELQDVQAHSPVRYWEHVRAYAQRAENSHFRPILLLENRTKPNWVYQWLSGYSDSLEPPEDLEVWRDPQAHGSAYIANMNNVPVYLAPSLQPGCSVLMTVDLLRSVCFEGFPTGNKVLATAEPIEGETSIINLRLTWAYAINIERYRCLRLNYKDSSSSAT